MSRLKLSQRIIFVVEAIVLLGLLLATWNTQPAKAEGPVFYGQQFGWENGHHYVEFRVNLCALGWRVEGPLWPILWANPDGSGIARAGFRWPDWLPIPCFLKPWHFRLYPTR